jgi:hypothetical protein
MERALFRWTQSPAQSAKIRSATTRATEQRLCNDQSSRSLVERAMRMRSQLMRWLRGGGGISLLREAEENRRVLP